MMEDHFEDQVYKEAAFCLVLSCFLVYLLMEASRPMERGPRGKELGEASGSQPGRNWGPHVPALKELNHANESIIIVNTFKHN